MDTSNFINTNAPLPLGNYPHLKRVGNFIFISGTSSRLSDNTHRGTALNEDGTYTLDIREQTHGVIKNIELLLASVSCNLSHIIDITTYLIDMGDFKGYNEVYGMYFDKETGPTRTTVAVKELPHKNIVIEIKAIAYLEV